MPTFVSFLVVFGGFAVLLGGIAWLGTRARRRGIGGGLMGPIDEVWHPAAHQARVEVKVQSERMAPNPSPDDPWKL